jgi:hypothetical protein
MFLKVLLVASFTVALADRYDFVAKKLVGGLHLRKEVELFNHTIQGNSWANPWYSVVVHPMKIESMFSNDKLAIVTHKQEVSGFEGWYSMKVSLNIKMINVSLATLSYQKQLRIPVGPIMKMNATAYATNATFDTLVIFDDRFVRGVSVKAITKDQFISEPLTCGRDQVCFEVLEGFQQHWNQVYTIIANKISENFNNRDLLFG